MNFFEWKCAYSDECIGGRDNENRTIDHITPLNLSGVHEIWNLVPMLKSYNSSKQDRLPMKWYKQQDFYSEERLNKIVKWQIYAYDKWSTEEDIPLILITDNINDEEIA